MSKQALVTILALVTLGLGFFYWLSQQEAKQNYELLGALGKCLTIPYQLKDRPVGKKAVCFIA